MESKAGTLDRLINFLRRPRVLNYLLAISVALILAAIYLAFWSLHPVTIFEAIFLGVGIGLLLLRAYLSPKGISAGKEAPLPLRPHRETIGERTIRWFTLNNRLRPYFIIIGILLIALDYLYNRFLSTRPELGSSDYLLIGMAFLLIFYDRIPKRFSMERDFMFLFLLFILLFLIIPLAIFSVFIGDPEKAAGSQWVHYFVSIPASYVANLIGVHATAVFTSDNGSTILFTQADGSAGGVGIALGCSGLWSVVIFFCAYMSYLLSNHAVLTRKLELGLLLGFVLAWFANLIRIALTIGAGAWWGGEALLWFHENVGILIFLAWTAFFWFFLFKYLVPPRDVKSTGQPSA